RKAHGLAARGHEVHVITHGVRGIREESSAHGVHVTRIPGAVDGLALHTEAARWLCYSTLVAAEVAALNRRVPLDIVDFPEYGGEAYVHLLNRTDGESVASVVQLHGPLVMLAHTIAWPQRDSELYRTGTAMEAASVRLADAVFSSSRCSTQWCARHYALDAASVPVIHAGVDVDVFIPSRASQLSRPTVVFVGRVAESKGVGTLVDACCEIARRIPELRLCLVGRADAAFAQALAARARARGCPELLQLRGHVSNDALPEVLCAAHVFAAPSRYEGGPGFVYLEAMACGLPVVACTGNGASDVIAEARAGALVEPGDVAGTAEALTELLLDEERRARFSRAARDYAVAHADTRKCIAALEGFYQRVIRERS
ncbi:MAG TPA: glycosyltransferase family 4 protein, partial [Burkholderiales bacterium]|nr:glycosyltransferase family 4 protein [Burkholderiales bacterium]